MEVNVMNWADRGQPKSVNVLEIYIHPDCDNQYDPDSAVLYVEKELPFTRNVWIHSAENIIFKRNLDRIIAVQGVLGRCAVPVFRNETIHGESFIRVDYIQVNYQHWWACRANVCPWWGAGRPLVQENRRCHNLLNGTRYCLAWEPDRSMCELPPGTPIFCDLGNIHGLMGFITNETFTCSVFDQSGMMTSVADSIDWIRDTLMLRYHRKYIDALPEWMVNLRINYTSHYVPHIKIPKTTTESPIMKFDSFAGDQIRAMVVFYVDDAPECVATLVASFIAILPCSCLTINTDNMLEPVHISNPTTAQYMRQIEVERITIGSFVNRTSPKTQVTNYELHAKCDNHYENNYALILLNKPVIGAGLAWIMTAHEKIFSNLLRAVSIADQSMGHNCYWVEANLYRKKQTHSKHKIRFVQWTDCLGIVCPTYEWALIQEKRCYNISETSSLYCVKSAEPRKSVCDLQDGTPIFCNLEAARGFVGFINKGMDMLYESGYTCREKNITDQYAVLAGIDTYLPDFKQYTFINEMEVFIRDKEGLSLTSVSAPSFFVIFMMLLLMSVMFELRFSSST
ncbi:hypothetical protein GE061_012292 [Apolygus lucorum]|uniref:Peptidase S1 domain-containing protein n=1 Tax=Apolygus lucorum TaxID=248454 RepID=A0A6A4JIM7_APOLU|nr:hypothetical protein GE061_012292 [Apolygus lucorum]